jgi:hypothetical protein
MIAAEGTENAEKKKFEIRSTKCETISKPECSKEQNESESRVTQINADLGIRAYKYMRIYLWGAI